MGRFGSFVAEMQKKSPAEAGLLIISSY